MFSSRVFGRLAVCVHRLQLHFSPTSGFILKQDKSQYIELHSFKVSYLYEEISQWFSIYFHFPLRICARNYRTKYIYLQSTNNSSLNFRLLALHQSYSHSLHHKRVYTPLIYYPKRDSREKCKGFFLKDFS